jgi:hypothetical protein
LWCGRLEGLAVGICFLVRFALVHGVTPTGTPPSRVS